jgi:hypothetical protein
VKESGSVWFVVGLRTLGTAADRDGPQAASNNTARVSPSSCSKIQNYRRTSFRRCSAPIMPSIVASDIPLIYIIRTKTNKEQSVSSDIRLGIAETYRLFSITTYLSQALGVRVRGGLLHLRHLRARCRGRALAHRYRALPVTGHIRYLPSLTLIIGSLAIVDATLTPPTVVVLRMLFMATDPGPCGDRAKGEPDETGGTTDHVTILVVAVPMRVVWHTRTGGECAMCVRGRWSLGRSQLGFYTGLFLRRGEAMRLAGTRRHPPGNAEGTCQ